MTARAAKVDEAGDGVGWVQQARQDLRLHATMRDRMQQELSKLKSRAKIVSDDEIDALLKVGKDLRSQCDP